MNKQEVINKIKGMTVETFFSNSLFVSQPKVVGLIEQIEEPYKPVIPYYIADYLEKVKSEGDLTVVGAVNEAPEGEVSDWLILENVNTFAKAWVNGYEVEKEKRYTVKIKAVLGQYLGRYYLNDEELTPQFSRTQFTVNGERPTFTRKELESNGFGWVFSCEGIEVEEVE